MVGHMDRLATVCVADPILSSGIVRTSTHTAAVAGITFICTGSPAASTVGVIHTLPR